MAGTPTERIAGGIEAYYSPGPVEERDLWDGL